MRKISPRNVLTVTRIKQRTGSHQIDVDARDPTESHAKAVSSVTWWTARTSVLVALAAKTGNAEKRACVNVRAKQGDQQRDRV